jgi:energy-coupling factor transporter ATP-binding protein EcfA2
VSFSYGETPVLRDVSLDVRAGECAGISGDNSSGKSTLLLVAAGALRPSAGRVTRDAGENGVLYLPQGPERLFFAESVVEEIAFGLERRGTVRREARARAATAMREMGLDPAVFGARSPFHLSAGEMRRVAFAIASSLSPGLLLLDEPASCLDAAGRAALDALIRARTGAGGAVAIVSHDPGHMAGVAGRVWVLRDGGLQPS